MPKSWIETLSNVMPEQLFDLLMPPERPFEKIVWPLSLLALRKSLQQLSIPRNEPAPIINSSNQSSDANNNPNNDSEYSSSAKIKSILLKKKIKAKKQHEIERMSELTAKIANELNVEYIVDFGSGLGHLARFLAYGYGLNVCCVEKEQSLTDKAM